MRKHLSILIVLLFSTTILEAKLPDTWFMRHFKVGVEWGYSETFYKYRHYNIVSDEGYRIDEASRGFYFFPNGQLSFRVSYDVTDKFSLSLGTGMSGTGDDCRLYPVTLRLGFFPHTTLSDGFFTFIEGGLGIPAPLDNEQESKAAVGYVGEGYRLALAPHCFLDLMIKLQYLYNRPLIDAQDGQGYVPESSIRQNMAGYCSIGISAALSF